VRPERYVMTIQRPAATIAGLDLARSGARRVRVDLSVDAAHDRVLVDVWPGAPLASAAPGDLLDVALGTGGGDPQDVLATQVTAVDTMPGAVRVTAFAPSRALSSTYVGRSWRLTTLGQVVTDLLDEGDVDAGDVVATLALPAFHVDPHRDAWSVLHDLARRTGNQITSTAKGAVSFAAAPGVQAGGGLGGLASAAGAVAAAAGFGSGDGELREGAELLHFSTGARATGTALTRVTPSSSRAWFLLEASPDSGSDVEVVDVSLRSRDAADAATAAAAAATSRSSRSARLRVPGRPDLRAGAVQKARGQSWRILSAVHVLDAVDGYTCDLVLEADA